MPNKRKDVKEITSIEEAVTIGTSSNTGRIWFRGHPKEYQRLTPTIFREEYESWFQKQADFEHNCIQTFKQEAPAVSVQVPASEDHMAWLFLMRHNEMPTRLLDWTESILVALYFAVTKNDDKNGELWAIGPRALNRRIRNDLTSPMLNNPELNYLVEEPLVTPESRKALAEKLELQAIVEQPVAFKPPPYLRRMITQLSVFTIHPKPQPGKTIPELLDANSDLARYVIPKGCKKELRLKLECLGIKEWTLFPNLDSVSKQIKRTLCDASG